VTATTPTRTAAHKPRGSLTDIPDAIIPILLLVGAGGIYLTVTAHDIAAVWLAAAAAAAVIAVGLSFAVRTVTTAGVDGPASRWRRVAAVLAGVVCITPIVLIMLVSLVDPDMIGGAR
jgi:hypothetical protein